MMVSAVMTVVMEDATAVMATVMAMMAMMIPPTDDRGRDAHENLRRQRRQ